MTGRKSPDSGAGPADARRALDTLLQVNALFAGDLERFYTEVGLTGPRVMLLWQLGATGPCTMRDLARALGVTPRNVTGLVDGLVASGHVTRQPHPTDRRATLVTPTAEGSGFVARLQREHEELAEQLFGPVEPRRLRAFLSTLDEVTARLAALVEEATDG